MKRLLRTFVSTVVCFIAVTVLISLAYSVWLLGSYAIYLITPWAQLHKESFTWIVAFVCCFCAVWIIIYVEDLKVN